MTQIERFAMMNRLSRFEPEDLDPLLSPLDPCRNAPGKDIAPCTAPGLLPRPRLSRPDAIAIGVLIDRPCGEPAQVALRLAALSLEQDVEVIALTSLDYSGLERFGIRAERVAGGTAAEVEACRDQIMRFWGIEVLLPT